MDAGLRQLAAEGFMHNRARMITASFLTRNLGIDWRHGYAHFAALLADGDVAANAGNWQWVAGTGNNTRPNRMMNPLRQAQRFDRDGQYVRRYVPELAGLDPADIQTPWKLASSRASRLPRPDRGAVLTASCRPVRDENLLYRTDRGFSPGSAGGRHQRGVDDVDGGVGGLGVAAGPIRGPDWP